MDSQQSQSQRWMIGDDNDEDDDGGVGGVGVASCIDLVWPGTFCEQSAVSDLDD